MAESIGLSTVVHDNRIYRALPFAMVCIVKLTLLLHCRFQTSEAFFILPEKGGTSMTNICLLGCICMTNPNTSNIV